MTTMHKAATDHTLRLAALPTAPSLARVFVTQTAKLWNLPQGCIETAQLLVSELATNAVRHTGRVVGPPIPRPTETVVIIGVRVRLVGSAVRLEVWDNNPSPAVQAEQSPEAEGGRGLFLVEALSTRWGSYPSSAGGKVVWCEVATGGGDPAPVVPLLPKRVPRQTATSTATTQGAPEVALLERVISGLRGLRVDLS